jgi:hypothetical protein
MALLHATAPLGFGFDGFIKEQAGSEVNSRM